MSHSKKWFYFFECFFEHFFFTFRNSQPLWTKVMVIWNGFLVPANTIASTRKRIDEGMMLKRVSMTKMRGQERTELRSLPDDTCVLPCYLACMSTVAHKNPISQTTLSIMNCQSLSVQLSSHGRMNTYRGSF